MMPMNKDGVSDERLASFAEPEAMTRGPTMQECIDMARELQACRRAPAVVTEEEPMIALGLAWLRGEKGAADPRDLQLAANAIAAALSVRAEPVAWLHINSAPEDEHVILCTTGGHVGEALMLCDEESGEQKWTWALGPVHPKHKPLGWMPMPPAINMAMEE